MLVYAHKGPVLFVAMAFSTSTAGLALKRDLLFLLVVPLFCFALFFILSFDFPAYEYVDSQFPPSVKC